MTLEAIRSALSSAPPNRAPIEGLRALHDPVAAVAAVLRAGEHHGPELLFIRRAEHPLDPWSGHMALPGGRVDATDADPLDAAMRETREEVGLDLARHGALLGGLSPVSVTPGGRLQPLILEPYVFELAQGSTDLPLVPNEEVEETLWIPLGFFADRRNRATTSWRRSGASMPLPCYRFRERLIWGLTLMVVDDLLRRTITPPRRTSEI